MQLRECEYILAIAEEGNMGKAAQRLYVSQPTLSKMLTRLEETIGSPLFERQSTGMTPTAVGAAYIEGARRMLEMNAQWEQSINAISGRQPMIDLGLPILRIQLLTSCVLPRLSHQFPGLHVNYIHTPQSKLVLDVTDNKCALGIGIIAEKPSHILNYEVVGQEEYVLVIPRGHPLEKLAVKKEGKRFPHIAISHLKNTPFVLSRPDSYSTRVACRFFEDRGISPPVAMTMRSTGDVIHAVAGGAGAALLPSQPLSALGEKDRLAYLDVDIHEEPMRVGVLYRRGYTLSSVDKAFISLLRECYHKEQPPRI